MQTNSSGSSSVTNLLDVLPDGAIWLLPATAEAERLPVFDVAFANKQVRHFIAETVSVDAATEPTAGKTELVADWLTNHTKQIQQTYLSGEPMSYALFDSTKQQWLSVHLSRYQEGLLVLIRNATNVKITPGSPNVTDDLADITERKLQEVLDFSQTGFFVFTPVYNDEGEHVDFRFATINRMVASLIGQTPDVLTGAIASDWFISYHETGLFHYYKHTFDTGKTQRFDIHYNVDGLDRWFDVQCSKYKESVLVTFTDFTLLKQAQQALEQQVIENQQQAALLNSILDSSDSGIIAFASIREPSRNNEIVDFTFVVANKACVGLLHKTMDEMIGKTLLTIFPGNVETGLFDLYKHTAETGEPGRTEVYYNHDGLDFWLAISTHQLGDGFVVTFTDISAHKQANQAAEKYAEELVTAFDTSQTGMFLFLPVYNEQGELTDFRFKVANRQLGSYVGQEPARLAGELGSKWFPDYLTNGLFDSYRKAYITGRTQRFNFHYDGSGIDAWLDIMASKLGDQVLVTFTDFTHLKQLQEQLENSVADLRRTNANLEQFAYVASHDLQEPLRKIQSFGNVLKETYSESLGLQGADLIARMQQSSERMSTLIHDLLAYSRLTTKRDGKQPVDLQTLLNQVLDDLIVPLTESGAEVEVGPLPIVSGHQMQLQQLLQNLLTNAIKFRRDGVKPVVRISVKKVPATALPDSARPVRLANMYVCLRVQDNGIGFEEKYAERIFQVFQRLHGRSQYAGTGIGLAIVQKVVENHGGTVIASSQPGEGATFSVYLPA
ncbi:Phytochrome-like protein cph1 [Fibrella aestuarina BUZ 2]|uniref:histidine kinase n=1 Tax=Fibrella aestuarina BUZ 2 TaxID=1166018 RepID=I0KA46_9BACT|nr:ATP-binding protein [Fibrella aestuarina]CCH00999.1 Phytochrome-like protein cph1 [Fibrella aestuarina BUZ 2]